MLYSRMRVKIVCGSRCADVCIHMCILTLVYLQVHVHMHMCVEKLLIGVSSSVTLYPSF